MAKRKETTQPQVNKSEVVEMDNPSLPQIDDVEVKVSDHNYTETALTRFKRSDGLWVVAKIRFDPSSLAVSPTLDIISETSDNYESIERFKILAVQEKLV